MIRTVSIFIVAPVKVPAFISALRAGGLWQALNRQLLPGLAGTDLIRSRQRPAVFLATDFWISEEDYERSRLAPACLLLAQFLRALTICQIDLGIFALPPQQAWDRWDSPESLAEIAQSLFHAETEDA
jgi:hypothetical protein